MRPDKGKYDVRAKKFGPPPPPQSLGKEEIESYVIELTSVEPHWYKFRIDVEWYDSAKKDSVLILQSLVLSIEFAPVISLACNLGVTSCAC